ncbi:shikimate dehydrogenase [Microbacterium sp. 10M-3C3]|jgi:shikimate dehydrogenase|uniref:shikimate dehydrogenase family protein n=1 Tax=Microbacterium sp. 10M-3C3 TaxID=2483401 RepID=UPI000F62DCD5|nr:shikimate dehydrogenase [Microbacterium sp. 10M-3C3]
MLTGTRLAVWGDPIAHSLSPALHTAAYRVLEVDWEYGRARVDEAAFPAALAALDASWRGLSLTMPLKSIAARTAVTLDAAAERTGAVNTLVLTAEGPRGFNTDVGGLVRALHEQGVERVERARILGAGATATSALVALADLGARDVEVVARRTEAVAPLAALGSALDIEVTAARFGSTPAARVDVTVSTLPGGTDLGAAAAPLAQHGGLLVDVVYGGWPTALAEAWVAAGSAAVSGLPMLLHQALLQVRVFVAGDPARPVQSEPAVLAAMRRALVGD